VIDSSTTEDLKVYITSRESRCDECKEDLGHHAWITLEGGGRAVCLACADLDHLVFLPSGDTALTRRARKHSVSFRQACMNSAGWSGNVGAPRSG
jgi:hypothetical protein